MVDLKSSSIVMQTKKYPTLLPFTAGCLQINTELPFKQTTHSSISPKNQTKPQQNPSVFHHSVKGLQEWL